jgi:large subunit ribosomal protein L25
MTKQAMLKVETRGTRGKGAARRLRRAGSIPGSLYGREIEPVSVQADTRDFAALVSAISVENTIVELSVDGDAPRRVLIREIQRHPVRPDFLHVDFYEIRAGEKLKVNVPLHLIGTPIGVRNGGTLQQVRHELEIECLPSEIPPSFEIDISELEIGDSLHISDVDAGGLDVMEDGARTICAVAAPRVVEEPVDEEDLEAEFDEEDAEPEVITARGDDDTDGGDED